MMMAVNQGVPLVISAREHAYSRDVYRLARLLTSTAADENAVSAATANLKADEAPVNTKLVSRLKAAFR
jgi:hypothetical protein